MDSDAFLNSARKLFVYYQRLGDNTFQQLHDGQLFWRYDAEANSIAILVNHLAGNMMSRWTDFLVSDGEKTWRNRDREFESAIDTRRELLDRWQSGWSTLYEALDGLGSEDLDRLVYIRGQGHTVREAIHRQMTHYAYHVGQIVLLGRLQKGKDWRSLSVPRGQSRAFNEAHFEKGRRRAHFTDEEE